MSDIIDRINELVDGQLQQERSGYDHNINQKPCPNCGREWHGLPLTQHVAQMYAMGRYEPEYIAAQDDSPIICKGSTVVDPDAKRVTRTGVVFVSINVDDVARHMEQMRQRWAQFFEEIADSFAQLGRQFNEAANSMAELLGPRPKHPPQCLWSGVNITFGQHNWHYELQVLRPALQFPRVFQYPHYRILNPLELEVHQLWPQFTAPGFPVPPRPGYDFTAWAVDVQHGPPQRHRADVRTDPRRPATAARRNGRRARG
ncbi:hypothetical protein [Mycobacterium sp. PSTR-4-N]|uniref:hypothetical protein n=1 Tax=Mycobacterium sp. PSTR-4-N TaxID=2917745 RepID=UPI001F14E37A|nr:hypothetical protein [Mycobacterium sp. PSTR-4-N]MCG7592407.1 hypothetical protein [Mycobacterium sp. PSTR-4-N]